MIAILSFYSFINISATDLPQIKTRLTYLAQREMIKGTIILATEGFNGAISGNEAAALLLVNELIAMTAAQEVEIKTNYWQRAAHDKFKVKIKAEIVTMGISNLDVQQLKGSYIEATAWDEFIASKDVITIDVRNTYEVSIGSFAQAINPETTNFKQFVPWSQQRAEYLRQRKVATFCTGGIRCEKATAYLKHIGCEHVYHLRGGILRYLSIIDNPDSKWQGNCFVFDTRTAVNRQLAAIESS